ASGQRPVAGVGGPLGRALPGGPRALPRGLGAMAAMFVVAPLTIRVDNRLIIGFGFLLTALSMWQMSQFSLQMGMAPVIISGLLQGFGLGCTQSVAPSTARGCRSSITFCASSTSVAFLP